MMFSFFGNGAERPESRSRRRTAISREPRLESLEERKLPSTLSLPTTALPNFAATLSVTGPAGNNTVALSLAGGNFLGTFNTTTLSSSYGLNPAIPIVVGTEYLGATATNNGIVYGNSVNNGGAIAYLVVTYGPLATTAADQDALQAAIWRTEFGNNFQLNGVDNGLPLTPVNSVIAPLYSALVADAATHTLPLGDVMWISPYSSATLNLAQLEGLVAVPTSTASTLTNVSSVQTSAYYGQPVTFGALVANVNPSGPVPTGSVQFQVDGVNIGSPVLLNGNGTANFTETTVGVGSHEIGAVYEPTGGFGLSASANNASLLINPALTDISLEPSVNPAGKGQPINILATVGNVNAGLLAIPVGTLVFNIDGRNRPAVNLFNGHAVRKGLKLPPGNHTITVYYTPSSNNFLPSQAQFVETVRTSAPSDPPPGTDPPAKPSHSPRKHPHVRGER